MEPLNMGVSNSIHSFNQATALVKLPNKSKACVALRTEKSSLSALEIL